MEKTSTSRIVRAQIEKYYQIAVYAYLTPLGLIFIYLLDSISFSLTQALLPVLAVVSLLPLGVVGVVFTIKGLRLSFKSRDYEKKDMGYANLIMGLIFVIAGLLGLGIAYVMVN